MRFDRQLFFFVWRQYVKSMMESYVASSLRGRVLLGLVHGEKEKNSQRNTVESWHIKCQTILSPKWPRSSFVGGTGLLPIDPWWW